MKIINSVKGNIKKLLSITHYKSIKTIQKENPDLNRKEIEEWLINNYNNIVEQVNDENKKIKNREKSLFNRQLNFIDTKDIITIKNLNKNRLKRVLDKLRNKQDKYIIKFNNKIFTLSDATKERLYQHLDNLYINKNDNNTGSDVELIEYIKDINEIKIEKIDNSYVFKEGAFFRYTHKLKNLDLSELQIFDEVIAKNYNDNCFIHSLKGQVSDEILEDCKTLIVGKNTTLKCIKKIAEKFNLYIVIKIDDNHNRNYGNKEHNRVDLCLIDNHYFKLCEIPITSFAIKNYNEIKNIEGYNEIIKKDGKYYKKNKKRFIDSWNVVKLLLENKNELLDEINKCDEIYKTCYYDDVEEIKTLNYNDDNVILNEYKIKIKKEEYNINVFFDFETTTIGEKHISYLCCIKSNLIKKTFYGENCGYEMLKFLNNYFKRQNIKLIAHNLGYDIRFIFKYLSKQSYIKRGNMIMAGNASFYLYGKEQKIKFQDSYSLIPSKLSGFGEMFGLKQLKEFMPYDLYTTENINKRYLDIDVVIKEVHKQVIKNNIKNNIKTYKKLYKQGENTFMSNVLKWDCLNDNKIDIIKYSEKYCEIDCEILEKGYDIFKTNIKNVCDLNIEDYVSIASIADAYFLKEGVYDGVYKLGGIVREYIQKCLVGGRTMCNDNKKNIVEGVIDDFDAVSLYPSAMERLGGYLKGKPKILKENCSYDDIKAYDGYFITIEILKVGKKRDFSLMSELTADGIRMFHNDMVGKKINIDKISLEDLIKFQEVEFKIIRGYYYNEGRNVKLKDVINKLFNERIKQKKLKNPIQNIFKLLMNSSYGKTTLKPIDEEIKYIYGKEKMNKILKSNYTFIKEITELDGDNYEIKMLKCINNHYNNVSCGVEILSMSKRIMNEVMCLAEDKNYKIYYQDTDSMHIDRHNITLLENDYKNIYGRDLVGKFMGQFHSDFSSDKLNGNIYSKQSIFLGKKCYLDVLTDETGEIDYHIRMKGISNISVMYHSIKDYKGDVYKLYKDLYDGKKYKFDLTCNNLVACFDSINMNTIISKKDFMREISF